MNMDPMGFVESEAYDLGVFAANEHYSKGLDRKGEYSHANRPDWRVSPSHHWDKTFPYKWTKHEGELASQWMRGYHKTWRDIHRNALIATHSQGFVIPDPVPDNFRGFDWERERWGEPVLILDYKAAHSGDMLEVKFIRTGKTTLMHYSSIWPERRSDIKRVLNSRDDVLKAAQKTIESMQEIIKALKK